MYANPNNTLNIVYFLSVDLFAIKERIFLTFVHQVLLVVDEII
jgi:hypothetical protein